MVAIRAYVHCIFQSTRPVRGATDGVVVPLLGDGISIHAPRAGRDQGQPACGNCGTYFNPRAPCGARPHPYWLKRWAENFNPRAPCGARLFTKEQTDALAAFQSTRPVRGATLLRHPAGSRGQEHFNPRAPCGARLFPSADLQNAVQFQSTRPVRGATHAWSSSQRIAEKISIHAPRAGRDVFAAKISISNIPFQSTRPVRGATFGDTIHAHGGRISIHAPRAGRDRGGGDGFADPALDFNPRAPCGARLVHVLPGPAVHHISIHAPRAGRDRLKFGHLEFHMISIHAPRAGRDRPLTPTSCETLRFQSTRPVRGATV